MCCNALFNDAVTCCDYKYMASVTEKRLRSIVQRQRKKPNYSEKEIVYLTYTCLGLKLEDLSIFIIIGTVVSYAEVSRFTNGK